MIDKTISTQDKESIRNCCLMGCGRVIYLLFNESVIVENVKMTNRNIDMRSGNTK
jgi:hypothetical protein